MADKLDFTLTDEVRDFFKATILGSKPITEVVLEGEPGCGKTLATRWLAEQLKADANYVRVVCTKETSFADLTTEKIIVKGNIVQQDSPFLQNIQKENSVSVIDEWMLAQPDVMAGLNSLLDYDRSIQLTDGRLIKRAETAFIIFSTNPRSYAGVKRQHGGLQDRLPTLQMGYLSAREEVALVHKAYPDLLKEDLAKIVKFATFIRNGKGTKQLTTVCSTRGILTMAQMMTNGASLEMAVRSTLKVPEEETRVINELMMKAMSATFVKNEATGEDELVLNEKLQTELTKMKEDKAKSDEQMKKWKEKAEAIMAAIS